MFLKNKDKLMELMTEPLTKLQLFFVLLPTFLYG